MNITSPYSTGIAAFLFLTLMINTAFAQPTLVLIKKNSVIHRFQEGDRIRLQKRFSKDFHLEIIEGIQRDFIRMSGGDTIYVSQIGKIDMTNTGKWRPRMPAHGKKLIAAGILLFAADRLNPGSEEELSKGVIIASGSLVTTGVIMQFIRKRYFRTSYNKRLIVSLKSR